MKYGTETQGSYILFGSLLSGKGLKDQLYSIILLVHTRASRRVQGIHSRAGEKLLRVGGGDILLSDLPLCSVLVFWN